MGIGIYNYYIILCRNIPHNNYVKHLCMVGLYLHPAVAEELNSAIAYLIDHFYGFFSPIPWINDGESGI